jgi:hypothetical protein
MPLYAYGTVPEAPPEPVAESQPECPEIAETEEDN